VPPLRQGLAPRRLMFFRSEEETFWPIGSAQLATIRQFQQKKMFSSAITSIFKN
jgi:hypothetical protein